jgi:hypothetical protein
MTSRVDTRSPDLRMEDIVRTADFERRTGIIVRRCECGASMLVADDAAAGGFACAGCRAPSSFTDRIEFHPAMDPGDRARGDSAPVWERSAPPETSADHDSAARKDADAPGQLGTRFSGRGSGSGVLGRVGKALRSLKLHGRLFGPIAGWRN